MMIFHQTDRLESPQRKSDHSMSLRSHVDPVLYTRFIMLDEAELSPEDVELWRAPSSSESLKPALNRVLGKHPRVLFHEAYHCFQGLFAPFLRRFALIAWHEIIRAFDLLSGTATDHRNWAGAAMPELARFSQTTTLMLELDGVSIACPPISVLEIVEGIATLVEWQMYAHEKHFDASDIDEFDLWKKRTPGYLKLYDIVSSVVGPVRALRSATALGTAALATSAPSYALTLLIPELAKRLPRSDVTSEFDDMDALERSVRIRRLLDEIPFEAPTNSAGVLWDTRFFRLSLPFGSEVPAVHPNLKRAYKFEGSNDDPAFLNLVHPELLPDFRASLEAGLAPPMTTFKIRFNDGSYRTHGMITGRYLQDHERTDDVVDGRLVSAMRFATAIFSVMRRATGAFYDPGIRTCELRACPEWEANFCNSYSPVPLDYAKCHFLDDLNAARRLLNTQPNAQK